MRTVVINNYFTPYRADLFGAIQARAAGAGVDVLYVSQPEAKRRAIGWNGDSGPRQAGTHFANDPALVLGGSGRRLSLPYRTFLNLLRLGPEGLVCTLSRDMVLAQILCLGVARLRRAKIAFWIGDVAGEDSGGFASAMIDRLRLACARRADGLIYYSEKSRSWFTARCPGVEPATIWIGGQVRYSLGGTGPTEPTRVRRSPVLRLLLVGGDDPRKGLSQLLADLAPLASSGSRTIEVLVAGSTTRGRARQGALRVLSLGRLDGAEMRRAYRLADMVIIASTREPWGFVFNEAILEGRPCIVSEHAGSATVAEDYGLAYRPGEPETLALALAHAEALAPETLAAIAVDLSPERAADSFLTFLRALDRGEARMICDY